MGGRSAAAVCDYPSWVKEPGMRILFLTENFPPEVNAAATRVYERACYWIRWGHSVTVVTSAPNFPQGKLYPGYANRWWQSEEVDGIRVIRVKTFIAPNRGFFLRILDFLSFMITGTAAGIALPRHDVVVATSPQFFTAVAGWMVGAIRRVPFVFELGDLWPASIAGVGILREGSILLRMLEVLELFLYREAAAVVALTQAFKDDLIRRGIPAGKITVVRNGVDLPRYYPRPKPTALLQEWGLEGKFVLSYVGTHGMAHDLGNILQAAERIASRAEEGARKIVFLFVGTGACRESLIEEAKRRGLPNVVFIPPQPKEKMPEVWAVCDVALVHLKNDPVFATVIPSKIFEAMGMGLPILLVAPSGEARTIVETEGVGIYVPAGDPERLATAVLQLAEHPEICATLAQASYAAAPRYSRERQAKEMIEVLKGLLPSS